MTLADTSAWIEFLRGTGSEANHGVRELLRQGSLATTDAVVMEVLAGARDGDDRARLQALLGRCELVAVDGPDDYLNAAGIYRSCRRGGDTIRSLLDCLVASVAIRAGLVLLHADSDFDAIARHAPLRVA